MIQEKYLVYGSRELGIIVMILYLTINLMLNFEVYEIKTIVTIFIIKVAISVIIFYCNFQLLLLELYRLFKNIRNSKKNTTTNLKNNENHLLTAPSDNTIINEKQENISIAIGDDMNNIRNRKLKEQEEEFKHKQDIAIKYIKDVFALYCSDEDIKNLCNAIIDFLNKDKKNIDYHSINITVTELDTTDLRHFGWNIWNYFRIKNQNEISTFLKNVFSDTFKDVDINSIKKHLKDEEKKGIIKIEENLENILNKKN